MNITQKHKIELIDEIHTLVENKLKVFGIKEEVLYFTPIDFFELYAKEIGVTKEYIINEDRSPERIAMRYALMYIFRNNFGLKLREIQELLDYSDHSSVLHAVRKCKDLLAINDEVMSKYYNIGINILNN